MISPKPFLLSAVVFFATAATASALPKAPGAFTVKVFAGAPSHAASAPDDITMLNGHVFVAWQNGVGPTGKPAGSTSLLVEYGHSGKVVANWPLAGRIDGIAATSEAIVATVNEDGNSSLYTVKPGGPKSGQVVHYTYLPAPDSAGNSAVHTGGGTDAVSILGNKILIAASAPTHKGRTATFRAVLTRVKGMPVARLSATFSDNAHATDALTGNRVKLHLTDPDSSAIVPAAGVFPGEYMLSGQADNELIFAHGVGSGPTTLTRLQLTYGVNSTPAGVDDVRWAPVDGSTLYVVDSQAKKIYRVKGPFTAGEALASMDHVGSKSLGTQVATLNDGSGELAPFLTGLKSAKGLLFTH
ncbi:MAG: hypothetical protein WCB67_15860 [Solirubrobacteraceae bacterium]